MSSWDLARRCGLGDEGTGHGREVITGCTSVLLPSSELSKDCSPRNLTLAKRAELLACHFQYIGRIKGKSMDVLKLLWKQEYFVAADEVNTVFLKRSCVLAEFLLFLLRDVPFCHRSWSLSNAVLQDSSLTGCHDVCLRDLNGYSGHRLVNRIVTCAAWNTTAMTADDTTLSQGRHTGTVAPSQVCSPTRLSLSIRTSVFQRLPVKQTESMFLREQEII